jgi:hypothetical protein
MKFLNALVLFCIGLSAQGQHTLTRLWETDTLAFPESVLYTNDLLYVSLLDHYPLREHGKGKIAKVALDGKIIDAEWIIGLDGPKGMGISNGKLYVADINQIVVIDIKNGKISNRILVPGSVGLNDLTIDNDGILYVSDPEEGKVYRVINSKPEIYLKKLPGVNGLKAVGNQLYLVASSNVFRCDKGKKLSSLSKFKAGADGLASLGRGNFLVTVYSGLVYYLNNAGKLDILLDSQPEKIGSADIEFDVKKSILYVPTLFHNSIISYQLK